METLIAQMGPMLILAGLATGWTSEAVARAGGYGLILDMALGIAGSLVLGTTAWTILAGDVGMIATFLIGCVGAALAIAAQRGLWRPVPVTVKL